MANAVYATGKNYLVESATDWALLDARLSAVTSGYTFSHSHTNMTFVTPYEIGASLTSLANKGTVVNTTQGRLEFYSQPGEILTVTGTIAGVVVYVNVDGTDANNIPLAFLDNFSPITLSGGDVILGATSNNWFYV